MNALLALTCFLGFLSLQQGAIAANLSQDDTPDESALLISFPDRNGNEDDAGVPEEIEITIDPRQEGRLEENATDSLKKLIGLSEKMQGPAFEDSLKKEVQIPISTANRALLEKLKELDPKTLQTFILRKTKYLQGLKKFFGLVIYRKEKMNQLLLRMNDSFFENPNVVVNLDTINIGSLGGFISIGPSLSEGILRLMRKIPFMKNLPDRSGFYFSTSLGLNFLMTYKNGKRRFRIEPVVDHRVGERFYTPFALIGFGLPLTVTFEARGGKDMSLTQAEFMKTSILTVIAGERVLGFSVPLGITLIPGGGAAAVVSGRLNRLNLLDPKNIGRIASYFKNLAFNRPKKCKHFFK